MQHDDDDDDDNTTAREIIKQETRARKHKGDERENDHYQPGNSGIPRDCCPQTNFCSLEPLFQLAQVRRALGKEDEQAGQIEDSSTSNIRDREVFTTRAS